jgi:hypothetical protein
VLLSFLAQIAKGRAKAMAFGRLVCSRPEDTGDFIQFPLFGGRRIFIVKRQDHATIAAMEELRFRIQGSQPDPYEIRIIRRNDRNVSAYCTCLAGENGQHCKHRIGILSGEPIGLIDGTAADVAMAVSWIRGLDIESIIQQLRASEQEFEAAKAKIAQLKKALAKAMLD